MVMASCKSLLLICFSASNLIARMSSRIASVTFAIFFPFGHQRGLTLRSSADARRQGG
jgi:hypothetical protein